MSLWTPFPASPSPQWSQGAFFSLNAYIMGVQLIPPYIMGVQLIPPYIMGVQLIPPYIMGVQLIPAPIHTSWVSNWFTPPQWSQGAFFSLNAYIMGVQLIPIMGVQLIPAYIMGVQLVYPIGLPFQLVYHFHCYEIGSL